MSLLFKEDGDSLKLVCDCFEIEEGEPGFYDDMRVHIMHDSKDANITLMCPECGSTLELGGSYIIPGKKDDKKDPEENIFEPQPEIEEVNSEPEEKPSEKQPVGFQSASNNEALEQTITDEQANYWMKVAKKDIEEDNRESAWNVQRWLQENNAVQQAKAVKDAIKSTRGVSPHA